MLAIIMVSSLLVSMSMWMIVAEDATIASSEAAEAIGDSVNVLFIIASAFLQLIIAWFVLKNGLGNLVFKVFVAIIGLVSVADLVNVIVTGDPDGSDLGFITWILWAISVIVIGVVGLKTKETT
jgi:hypothetical protein